MMNDSNYGAHLQLRQRLAGALTELSDVFGTLDAEERAKQLATARVTLENDAFRLMVVGEFKRGKSTLINAMLGDNILPAKVAPCTAVITEVKFSEDKRAVLHHEDETQPPLTVAVQDLKKYIVIDDADDDDEAAGAITKSPFSRLELFYPLPLCRNKVEIVDSPGLNEHKTRTKVALDYLSHADALIVVLSCGQALSQSEIDFINGQLSGAKLRNVFFLWNHKDDLESEDDFEDIRKRSRKYLEPRLGAAERIYFVSAREALAGRRKGAPADVARSGVIEFEQSLERFLTRERAWVKLQTPLRAAENSVREGLVLLGDREAMLRQPLHELQERYEAQRPQLDELERQRERLLRSVERRRDSLVRDAEAAYHNFVASMEKRIVTKARSIDVALWEAVLKRSKTAEKSLAEPLARWLSEEVSRWQKETLGPLFDTHMAELAADVEKQTEKFLTNLDAVRTALVSSAAVQPAADDDVSAVSRIVGAVGGLFLGGIGSAMEGATLGVGGMLKGAGVHMAVGFGLAIAGFGLPVILPVLAVIGIGRVVFESTSVVDQLRDRAARELFANFQKQTSDVLLSIRGQIGEQFKGIVEPLDAATRIKIDEVKGQVQSIIRERRESEARAQQRMASFKQARERLTSAGATLEAIRADAEA